MVGSGLQSFFGSNKINYRLTNSFSHHNLIQTLGGNLVKVVLLNP
jgi:hypothetical protein